jgi:hypothetical protein
LLSRRGVLVPSKWVRRFGNGEVYPKKAISDPELDFSEHAISFKPFCGPIHPDHRDSMEFMAAKRARNSAKASEVEIKSSMHTNLLKLQQINFPHLTQVGIAGNDLKVASEANGEAIVTKLGEIDVKVLKALHNELTSTNDVKQRLTKLAEIMFRDQYDTLGLMTESVDAGKQVLVDAVSFALLRLGPNQQQFQWEKLKDAIMEIITTKSREEGRNMDVR